MNTKVFAVVTLLFVIFGLGGCDQIVPLIPTEPEENDFVGVWTIHTIDGQTVEETFPVQDEVALADSFVIWTFYADGGFELLSGWTPAPDPAGTYVLPQVYFRIKGTYTVTGSGYTMTMMVEESIGFFDMAEGDETMSGTWVREGDTLTLTDTDGTVIVLKEKL